MLIRVLPFQKGVESRDKVILGILIDKSWHQIVHKLILIGRQTMIS